MMEPIVWNGSALAYVIRGTALPKTTVFPTAPDLEFQVGFVVYREGGAVAPHRHLPLVRTISRTCEVIYVRKGRCLLDMYNEDKQIVASSELHTGDLVLLLEGGHGFRMLEDTVLLEVKQGPYYGAGEKERLT